MAGWSTADLKDQTGRRVTITGANSGLGKEIALALGAAGAEVTLACRNQETAREVAEQIGSNATVAQLDLADLDSVRRFADDFGGADVLINNAGVMAVPLRRTADGFEMQIGTNFLGHFALTGLLLDQVSERVVSMSSIMHRFARLNVDDLNWQRRRYNRWIAYSDSKLADMMFGLELARRLAAAGSAKSSLIAHPGYAATELQGRAESWYDGIMRLGNKTPLAQTAADGALPALYAATEAGVANGEYYGPKDVGGLRGAPVKSGYRKVADDQALREQLWGAAEELTGVRFPV